MKAENIILFISIVISLLGLFLAGKYFIGMFFFNYHIQDAEMKFVFVLIGAGLLGSVLNFVLRKVVQEVIDKYIPEEKLKEIVGNRVDELKQNQKEEEAENLIIEKGNKKGIDTVIVPVSKSYNEVQKNKMYICPESYSFKSGLKYIAFYSNMEIIGYGQITSDYQTQIGGEKRFIIKEFIEKKIPHNRKGAFIQSKRYCTFDSLKNAQSTDDIKPNTLLS